MTFNGYLRSDGTAGTRNMTVVLPTINCADAMAHKISKAVEGTMPVLHNHACVRVGNDRTVGEKTLLGIGKNPNIGAVLLVGIGCEPMHADKMVLEIQKCGKLVDYVSVHEEGDYSQTISEGISKLKELKKQSDKAERTPCDLSKLIVTIKCTASGTMLLLSNNPVVGAAMDLLVAEGGTAIFSETAEILGAISKAGETPLKGVLYYGEEPVLGGVNFMDGSSQASPLYLGGFMVGSQIGLLSMGGGWPARFRGLPSFSSGFRALPTLMVLGSPGDEEVKDDLDFYAGGVITGEESIKALGKKLFDKIIDIANGELTKLDIDDDYQEMLQVYAIGVLM